MLCRSFRSFASCEVWIFLFVSSISALLCSTLLLHLVDLCSGAYPLLALSSFILHRSPLLPSFALLLLLLLPNFRLLLLLPSFVLSSSTSGVQIVS